MPSSAPHSLRYALSLHDALPIFDRGKRCIPNAIRADIAHGGAVGVRACDLAAGYRPCGITDQLDLVDHRGGLAARAWSSTDDLCDVGTEVDVVDERVAGGIEAPVAHDVLVAAGVSEAGQRVSDLVTEVLIDVIVNLAVIDRRSVER